MVSASATVAQRDLDRLIALGRQKGELSPADLQAALPIHGMSAEAIAQVVLDLEAAGIPVELEDLLTGRAHPDGIARLPLAPAPGPPSLDAAPAAPRPDAPASRAGAPVAAGLEPGPATPSAEGHRVRNAVLVAGLIVLVLMGAVLIALGR
ncbi:hypothetical protein ASG51_13820 [Methylobacterium sp. Leaf465]|uniref:RNA polymerase sigma factor region1.1 domain-containing protein n=1 Tax=Methylobacterium sp. Leaf465 TaxID=1736385 RepID=UPI000701CB87|nr:RNA polymerase sigma factor region1.1 domain-containing protein [Methylobacterium sp. Leaf465]KQT70144.1 hypothetical protein ASG51_13820 [Methylobacterium sp. Leaf465]